MFHKFAKNGFETGPASHELSQNRLGLAAATAGSKNTNSNVLSMQRHPLSQNLNQIAASGTECVPLSSHATGEDECVTLGRRARGFLDNEVKILDHSGSGPGQAENNPADLHQERESRSHRLDLNLEN